MSPKSVSQASFRGLAGQTSAQQENKEVPPSSLSPSAQVFPFALAILLSTAHTPVSLTVDSTCSPRTRLDYFLFFWYSRDSSYLAFSILFMHKQCCAFYLDCLNLCSVFSGRRTSLRQSSFRAGLCNLKCRKHKDHITATAVWHHSVLAVSWNIHAWREWWNRLSYIQAQNKP